VQDIQLFKSLGAFAIILLGLFIGVGIYFLLRCCTGKLCTQIKDKLHEKLFYNSFLRYMIVSNLKLNYTIWGFLIFYYSFESHKSMAITCVLMAALYFLVCYPVLIMIGLLRNQHRVEEKKFNHAFNQLWQGINTNSSRALLYESIFCIRRFYIVLINVSLSPTEPLNNFE